ncbi:hypothetical protein LOTGIDRAFT_234287 [Lottia gigantea]|uniref:MGA conserved domain-containing protein n=1 Tax=Lottia gigantea TaxID=225164 RepID=V4BLD4_LOTGI|nr:hypothetical protein LOTGIDRAFT_234287 [Lottia gigantea]ESO89434.1 hypothetical protein LOTGIDRAFT_234287 [Lottia gigantea]
MARTKKKELQKVKAEEAKNRRQAESLGGAPWCNEEAPGSALEVKDKSEIEPDVSSEVKSEKKPLRVAPKTSKQTSLTSYNNHHEKEEIEELEDIKPDLSSLPLHPNANLLTPSVTPSLTSTVKTESSKKLPIPRKPASLNTNLTSQKRKSPKSNRIKSPKNIFEKLESQDDSENGGEKKASPKNKKTKSPTLAKSPMSKSPKSSRDNSPEKKKSSKSPGSCGKSKTCPKRSPKIKDELSVEKKRIRSPKLLTDDMILLPLVDHRKARASPKTDKKSDPKKLQKNEEISAVRKLSFVQNSEGLNLSGNSFKDCEGKISNENDCKPLTYSDSISSLNLSNSTLNSSPNLSLNELISRMNNRLKIPQEVINSGKVVKSGHPEETVAKPGNSSDETLPACDSPDSENLSTKLNDSTECLPSCSATQPSCSSVVVEKQTLQDAEDRIDDADKDEPQLVSGFENEADRNKIQPTAGSKTPEVLKTRFIGEYVIQKPEDDIFPLVSDTASSSKDTEELIPEGKVSPENADNLNETPIKVKVSSNEIQNNSEQDEDIQSMDTSEGMESCSKSAGEMKNLNEKVEEKESCENIDKMDAKDAKMDVNFANSRQTDLKEAEPSPEFGNILCNLLLKGRQTPVDMATSKDKIDNVNFKTSTPKSVLFERLAPLSSNTTTPIKSSPGSAENSLTEVSPKSKKNQETKEPLPISILSRHETSEDKNSAFFSLDLEKYLAVPTNRFLGLEKNTLPTPPSIKLEKQSPEFKADEKNEYECFEPDFDEVDGALFLSFSTEEALQAHIKVETKAKWDKDTSTFLGISRMLEVQKHESHEPSESVKEGQTPTHGKLKTLRGQHMRWKKYQRLFHRELTAIFNAEEEEEEDIKPQKTSDITKIKGWKLKFKNKLGSHSGKKNKSATVTSLDEQENYWSGHEDDPIVLNSSGSEVEFDEDEVYGPMVVEYTEAMVPPLPEIPQLSRALRKIMIKKLGYDEEDEQVILKLGGRRVIVQKGKDGEIEDGEDTPKEKKKRNRRKKKDLALAMSETMLDDALRAVEPPETSDKESGVEELPEDLDEKIDDNEIVEVQVKAVDLEVKSDDIDVKPFDQEVKPIDLEVKLVHGKFKLVDEKFIKKEVKDFDEKFKDIEIEVKAVEIPEVGLLEENEEEDCKDSTVRNGKTGCDKLGCHFGCICHLCNLAPLDEPDNQEQTTVCDKEYCRLGCICDSLGHKVIASRTRIPHCGKAKCMLECICDKIKQTDKTSEVTPAKGDNSVTDLEADNISASSKMNDKSKQNKSGKRKKRKSVDDSVVVSIDQDDDPEYKQKMGKKRTERFSNLPKRESTYRVAKNLDAVNRKAMMVYSVSECYSEQRSNRKRKSDTAQPEVVIERDDDEDQIISIPVSMPTQSPTLASDSTDTKQPAKKKSRKQSMEQKSDEFEMSGVEAIKDSVEEAGCELSRLLTMDLPLKKLQELHSKNKGSVLEAVLRNGADAVNKIKSEPNQIESGSNLIEESGIKVEKLERQKLLREQLLKEQEKYSLISDAKSFIQGTELKGAVSNSAAKNLKSVDSKLNEAQKSLARKLECRWHTQMVCLKPHQNAAKNSDSKLPEEIKLLEFIANCNWDMSKPQILKRVAQCLRPGLYPTPRQLAVGDFCVEILPQAKKPPIIPPELKSKLPEMMYSIRIKVTSRKDILPTSKQPQNGATGATPKRPILAVPILGKSNCYSSAANTSAPPVSASMPTGSISAFSRFQISQPGQNKFKQSTFDTSKKFSLPKLSANTSEVVDLTNDEAEETKNKTLAKKRKKRDKVKDQSEPPKKKKTKKMENVIKSDAGQIKNVTSSANAPTIIGPFELNDLKNLKTSDGKSKLLKLVSPNVMVPANATKDSSKDLIAVPIQIGSHFNPNIPTPLIACPAVAENSPINLSMNNSGSKSKVSKSSPKDMTSSDDFIIENDVCSEEDLDIGADEFSLSELQDDDSRSSGVGDHNWLKDFQEEDGSTIKKHYHNKLEKIRRQQMRALFIRLKCIVVPDFEPTGAFNVFKEKLLREATNIITEEEEGSILLSEVLVKERKKHQFLLKKIIDLMEEMWKSGLSEDTIKEALELRKDNTPARLVARVIEAIESFSKTRKIGEKEIKDSDVFDMSIKNSDNELSSLRNLNESQSVGSSSMSDQASSLVANGNSDQVVDLISDSSSSNTSRSNTPIEGAEGVDLDQLPEDEPIDQEFDIDPATNLLRDRNVNQFDCDNEAKNTSLHKNNTQILPDPNLQELNANNNNLQKTPLQDSDFASSTKVSVDPLQSFSLNTSQESSTIAADNSVERTDLVCDENASVDPLHDGNIVAHSVHDGNTTVDPVGDGNSQLISENVSASNPSSILNEKVSSPCDMLDLIDKSLPGNLELYEDISDSENTSNIISARTDQSNSQNNNFQNGGMAQIHQTTFSNNVPEFQNEVQSFQKCMDPLTFQTNSTSFTTCDPAQPPFSTNDNSEEINCETVMSESESSDALFKFSESCPLSLIN